MAEDYPRFDWQNLGSPLTPFVAMKFRGINEFYYTFPDKNSRIYIENAQFDVFEQGVSKATITLCDPEFYNLETIFVKAAFIANSLAQQGGGYWFCACFWGWSYYGKEVGDADNAGNRKVSGIHYYLLEDFSYNLSDVDLRVTFTLKDVGSMAFEGDNSTTVGLLQPGDGITHRRQTYSEGADGGTGDGSGSGSESRIPEEVIAERWNAENPDSRLRFEGREDYLDVELNTNSPSATPSAEGEGPPPEPLQNVISGKSYWEIIQIICAAHGLNAIARPEDVFPEPTDGPAPGEGAGTVMSPEYGRIVISQDDYLTDTLDSLINKITNQPVDGPEDAPTYKWNMLAGGRLNPQPEASTSSSDMDIVFGWTPQPPKSETDIESYFRLGRVFTYRPGYKGEIAAGETMINSLTYDWVTRKTLLGQSLPMLYAITVDEEGNHKIYYTSEDYLNRDPNEQDRVKADPTIGSINLADAAGRLGMRIEMNFDARSSSDELVQVGANAIMVNVWNQLLGQTVYLSIEIPGDPWLDNTIFASTGDPENSKLLVNVYDAYFKVKVYKLSPGAYRGGNVSVLSELISGNYTVLYDNGLCSHRITEGEYTTSLRMFKPY